VEHIHFGPGQGIDAAFDQTHRQEVPGRVKEQAAPLEARVVADSYGYCAYVVLLLLLLLLLRKLLRKLLLVNDAGSNFSRGCTRTRTRARTDPCCHHFDHLRHCFEPAQQAPN
jgi:hypothetical protein